MSLLLFLHFNFTHSPPHRSHTMILHPKCQAPRACWVKSGNKTYANPPIISSIINAHVTITHSSKAAELHHILICWQSVIDDDTGKYVAQWKRSKAPNIIKWKNLYSLDCDRGLKGMLWNNKNSMNTLRKREMRSIFYSNAMKPYNFNVFSNIIYHK